MGHDGGMLLNRRSFTAVLGLAALAHAVAATGAPLSDAEIAGVRAVVQGQLDAFAANDAAKAFSYAAPNVRSRLGTAERFMAMVRAGYPVVFRPASVAFLLPQRLSDGTVVQRAQMSDARGETWLAVYTLQRQKDKSWRISGCDVQPARGRAT
ncbi:MAG: DUF4864 domain-containing protein [Rubrivivax sp.]|nr:DUF4864 domain-containing protein [Rubrivivax sp.]